MVVNMVLLFNAKTGVQMSVSICCTHCLVEIDRIDQKTLEEIVHDGTGEGGVSIVSLFIAKAGMVDSAIRSLVGHLSFPVTCQTQNGG